MISLISLTDSTEPIWDRVVIQWVFCTFDAQGILVLSTMKHQEYPHKHYNYINCDVLWFRARLPHKQMKFKKNCPFSSLVVIPRGNSHSRHPASWVKKKMGGGVQSEGGKMREKMNHKPTTKKKRRRRNFLFMEAKLETSAGFYLSFLPELDHLCLPITWFLRCVVWFHSSITLIWYLQNFPHSALEFLEI